MVYGMYVFAVCAMAYAATRPMSSTRFQLKHRESTGGSRRIGACLLAVGVGVLAALGGVMRRGATLVNERNHFSTPVLISIT
jgi:hypothetical protein